MLREATEEPPVIYTNTSISVLYNTDFLCDDGRKCNLDIKTSSPTFRVDFVYPTGKIKDVVNECKMNTSCLINNQVVNQWH